MYAVKGHWISIHALGALIHVCALNGLYVDIYTKHSIWIDVCVRFSCAWS